MRIVVTGSTGRLGKYLVAELKSRGHEVVAWSGYSVGESLRPVDMMNDDETRQAICDTLPDTIVHAAAVAHPALAAYDKVTSERLNVHATSVVAKEASRVNAKVVFTSSDMVFRGDSPPYRECDQPDALTCYGGQKHRAETKVLDLGGLAIRLSLMYGPTRYLTGDFFNDQVSALREGKSLRLFHDEYRTPLALGVAAAGIAEVCEADANAVAGELFHLGGPERMSRVEFYERLAAYLGVEAKYESISRLDIDSPEPRPADVSLNSDKFYAAFPGTPRWTMEEALDRMM